uniref:glycosyltransferase family 4 protein n=1 Tax=Alloprevotella sp. TaxID=1872471 RepID=UPI00402771C8
MGKLELCVMDMTQEYNTSGVDRYIDILCDELSRRDDIHFIHVQLVESKSMLFLRKRHLEHGNSEVKIPLPVFVGGILEEFYWIEKYAELVYEQIKEFLPKENLVIHLNTLNLIDLATLIKKKIPHSRVITHLHCIPWKSLYNKDKERFNVLYSRQQVSESLPVMDKRRLYARLDSEWRAYHEADDVICVTRCARNFLARMMERVERVHVIPNGMPDIGICSPRSYEQKSEVLQCLYAGVLSESKGVGFIFQALEYLAKQNQRVRLVLCGHATQEIENQLRQTYPMVEFEYCGLLSFEELQTKYRQCDIGILPSLQEQSSYVAIEMMRHGMPIITTAVDGLDEMFVDGVDALKVKPLFSLAKGLYLDVKALAEAIVDLWEHPTKRESLGRSARETFLKKHTVERMIKETICVYKNR